MKKKYNVIVLLVILLILVIVFAGLKIGKLSFEKNMYSFQKQELQALQAQEKENSYQSCTNDCMFIMYPDISKDVRLCIFEKEDECISEREKMYEECSDDEGYNKYKYEAIVDQCRPNQFREECERLIEMQYAESCLNKCSSLKGLEEMNCEKPIVRKW